MNDLDQILRTFRLRLRLIDGWLAAQRSLWIPAAAMLCMQIIGRLFPIEGISAGSLLQPWSWGLFLAWGIAVLSYALIKPMSLMQTALRVDASLGLKERLSSTLALRQMADVPEMLRQRQRADALGHAAVIHPRQAFPFTWLRKPVAVAGAIFALSILSIWLPNPMDALLQERAAYKQAILEEAEKMSVLRQQIETGETAEELTPAQREELLRQLEELTRALKTNPGDLEQALADLDRFEQGLRQNLDPNIRSKQAYLDALAAQLSKLSGKQPAASSDNPASAALQDLLDKLAADPAGLDADPASAEKQRQEAARSLAQMAAQASQAGDNTLSQALSSLAQALQEGDPQAVDAATQAAQTALQQLNQQLENQQAIQGLLAQAQSSQQALSQAGRQVAQSQGQTGSTTGQPAGAGGASGQPSGSGGGSMANQLPPSTGGRTSVYPRGSAAAAQTGAFDSQVYAPWQRSANNGEQLFIPGQDTNQGQTTTTEGQSSQAGLSNPALMPYSQVFFQYLTAANQAMQQNYIPVNLQDYVRLYFSSLEPK